MIGEQGENLIFVVGVPRSGTTLVQRVLASHSKIAATAEPWVMLHPLYALHEFGHTAEYDAGLAHAALRDFWVSLPEGRKTYIKAIQRMAATLYNGATPPGKIFFLDKTPRYYNILPELAEVFPNAKFVTVVRNPLGVLSSVLDSWVRGNWPALWSNQRDLLAGPERMEMGIRCLGRRSFLLRYENFAAWPEKEFSRLCGELEIDYEPDMLNYGTHKPLVGSMGDSMGIPRFSRPVAGSISKWVPSLAEPHARDIATRYLNYLNPRTLTFLGYPKDKLWAELHSLPSHVVPQESWKVQMEQFFV